MRARTPRRLVAVALTTAIVVGSAGTALAADRRPPRTVGAEAPAPGADAVLKQVKALADLGGALTPVTDLLTAALGGASPADVTSLAAKATAALDTAKAATPATPATSATPATPVTPANPAALTNPANPSASAPAAPAPSVPAPAAPAPSVPAAPTAAYAPTAPPLPRPLPLGGAQFAAGPTDVRADAVASLKKSLDSLVKAATGAHVAGVVPAATQVVTGLVGLVVATVVSGGLPVPNLPGLPALPKHPAGSPPVAPPKLPA